MQRKNSMKTMFNYTICLSRVFLTNKHTHNNDLTVYILIVWSNKKKENNENEVY